MLVIFIIAVVCALLYYYIRKPYKYWESRKVPNPPVSYIFGNVGDAIFMKKSIGQVYHDIYTNYPDAPYVGLYKMREPYLLIRDPELVKEVMVKHFNSFRDNDVHADEKIDPMFARNPFASKGQLWKERRSQSTPSFTAKRIKEMYPLMEGVSKNLIEFINSSVVGNPEGVEIKDLCMKFTTDAVANCALGIEANSFLNPNSDYIRLVNKIISPSFANAIKFLLVFVFPSLANLLKVQVIPDDSTAYFKNVIQKTLEYRTANKITRGDFLDSMNELQLKIGSATFTTEDITAHVISFFTDGTETSALAFSFTLYELGLHPDVQTKLKKEIEETRSKNMGKLNYEIIQNMEYLEQVISENLRINTPALFNIRLCNEQVDLETTQGKGETLRIEKGIPVVIPFYSFHHDSTYYPNPSQFDPTRFTEENIEQRPKYTYLPFGEGPRTCIGQRFALAQIKIALVHVIEEFEVRVNKSTTVPYEIDPHYFMLAAKGGIRMDFYKRS